MDEPRHPSPNGGHTEATAGSAQSPDPAAGTNGIGTAVISTLEALEWPRLLEALASRISTPAGQVAFSQLAPLPDVEAVRRSLTLVQELKILVQASTALAFDGAQAIGPLIDRAEKEGTLDLEELIAVFHTQEAALRLRDALTAIPELPGLRTLAGELHAEQPLCTVLARAFTPDGSLNERTYPNLARLRTDISRQREAVHRLLEGLIRSKALEQALQEPLYTLRGHRYVLPIKTDFRGQVPGIVHDVSASGATLFIEPHAIVEETNSLALLEKHLDLETQRILRELSHQVGYAASSLRHNLYWLGRLDLLHAQARFSEAISGTAPEVWTGNVLALKGLAHPLLLLAGGETVRNDIALGGEAAGASHCMVISGANSGGKTVLLKAVGLSALLIVHGMHIPALGGSRMDWFPHVWAEAGDPQDLGSALSTFSARIQFVANVLRAVGPGHLVLLDELMGGTEPQEGAALAAQVVRALVARGAICFVTTHYGDLKLLANQVPGVVNASVSFDSQRLVPTYRLQVGLPGPSYAFPIALHYGLEPQLVADAQTGLAGRSAALDTLLHDVQALRAELEGKQYQLDLRTADAQRAEADLRKRAQELDERRDRLRRQERGEVSRELRDAREKIAAVIHELQSAGTLPLVSKVRQQLAEVESELTGTAQRPDAVTAGIKSETDALEPGASVHVRSMGRPGVLVELIDAGRRARVRFGNLTAEVDVADLAQVARMPEKGAAPVGSRTTRVRHSMALQSQAAEGHQGPGDLPSGSASAVPSLLPTSDNTLDLRGLRLNEAMEQAERFFDTCVMKHISPVLLIHGHGTGKLKAGLRERLKESRYVAGLRPGDAGEGRDGVTVVALNV